MNAEIITIGDEILIGQIVDTNSQWIGQELNKIGISVYQISSVQDDREHILKALKEAESRVKVVIITGGLGPTKDDITKKTIAEYFNDDELIEYPEVMDTIKELFAKLNRPVKPIQKYQTQLPSKALLLKNQFGTAPGMWFEENDTIFVSLPGVPYEMKGLMTNEVLPKLQSKLKLPYIIHKTIHTFGQGESEIAERIADFENQLPSFIKLAYLPSAGKVRLRLSGKNTDKDLLEKMIATKVLELEKLIPEIISGYGEKGTLQQQIAELFIKKQKTICTVESITGGKMASTLTSTSKSSNYYKGGYIINKQSLEAGCLPISKEVITENSLVSEEVAKAVVVAAKNELKSDYAVSIIGNTDLIREENMIGQVFIGIATPKKVTVYEFDFGKPLGKILDRAIVKTLELLQKELFEN